MRITFPSALAALLLLATTTPVLSHPEPVTTEVQLSSREAYPVEAHDARSPVEGFFADIKELWKRRGGGGSGGRGGSSSGSSSSGSSSSSSSSSGTGSSGSSRGGTGGTGSTGSTGSSSSANRGSSSPSSNIGGSTKTGSGVRPNYGGGRYYGGGATAPYAAGGRSPLGLAPVFLGVGLLAVLPGLWLYGAYSYPYHHPYSFHNRTARANATTTTSSSAIPTATNAARSVLLNARQDTGVQQQKPVTCLCAAYAVCGCDDNDDTTFLDALIGDGDYNKLNHTLVTVADINGTSTIILNGTLPNGTTAADGQDDGQDNDTSSATRNIINLSGYWAMIALVGCMVFFV
ncbi:uncharacterized protein BP5553_08655 [Venustampulla echinocandica]|uniref:DUF7732 domain-containing protein n=1 Tax=Venustampulla echinocandica TaxID=2656787 RepID=A0A370TEV0_9HELO|nr:uncharacterized protein BP5553_08655 [Venustampulla echinocandica]RDL33216.1 hypothetical protein BP5553_08655 [Venustampulla echinocandica]